MNIHQAAFAGNIQRINEILESSPSQVNQILELKDGINTQRVTPIFFAAISGKLQAVTLLLEKNAVIQPGEEASELLRWSAYGKDSTEKFQILNALSKQRDIHISQLENLTTEQFKTSCIALKTLLSKNNFEYNLETIDTTYYHLAGFKGDIAHLREIMKSNFNPSALSLIATGAARNGKVEVLKFLHKEHQFNLKAHVVDGPYKGLTPAYLAAQNGHVNFVEYLYSIGVNLETPLLEGQSIGLTPALIAAFNDHVNVLEYLHSIAFNLEAPILDGRAKGLTTAFAAAFNGHVNVLEFLYSKNIDLAASIPDGLDKGYTPAYIAAKNGHVKVLTYLHSIDVNLEAPLSDGSDKGYTPALIAAFNGHVNVLEYLHSIAFNLEAPILDGRTKGLTAAYVATLNNKVNVLAYLHSIGVNLKASLSNGPAEGHTLTCISAKNGCVNSLEYLHSIGADLKASLSDGPAKGHTPAFLAAFNGHVNVLEYLQSKEINIRAPLSDGSHKGYTPAYIAAQKGHVYVLEYLHSISVNLTAPLFDGKAKGATPAFIAAHNGYVNVLAFLYRIGVNFTAPLLDGPAKGVTPAYIAAQNGHVNVLEFLHSICVNLTAPLFDGKAKGSTPAYIASQKGQINVLKFFSNEAKWIEDGFQNLWKTLSPFHIALLIGQPHHVKELTDFGSPIEKTINDAKDKEWSLIDFIGQAYQEKYVSKLENAVAICQILLEGGICKRDELLEVFKKTNFDLFEALLASPEKRLLKVLSEKKFLEKILTSRRTLFRGKALLRRDNSGENLLIQSPDLAHFIKEQIRIIISKDAPIYSPIKTEFTELSSTRVAQGYQFEWEPHKQERVVRILEDLERASTEISQMKAKSEAFQSIVPATYTLIDALDVPENGMEVEIPSM